jgi:hypothetical protein
MDVLKTKYKHGLAAVSRIMTSGKGRGGNKVNKLTFKYFMKLIKNIFENYFCSGSAHLDV